jgi:hypothetical protein
VSWLAALEACPRVPPHVHSVLVLASRTVSSGAPAHPLQAHRTPHLA